MYPTTRDEVQGLPLFEGRVIPNSFEHLGKRKLKLAATFFIIKTVAADFSLRNTKNQ